MIAAPHIPHAKARRDGRAPRRGFTLFEVVLAIALAAVLSGGIYAFLVNLQMRQERILTLSGQMRAGSALIERLEGDVLAAVTGTPARGAGISGGHDHISILTRGVTPPLASGVRTPLGDMQGVELQFEAESGTVRGRRFDALGEAPGGEMEEIASGLERLRLRYHDGSAWRGSFDSLQAGGLPAAIEVAVWFAEEREPAPPPDGPASEPGTQPGPAEGPQGGAPAGQSLAAPFAPEEEGPPRRAPDRIRVIVVPDGPKAGGER